MPFAPWNRTGSLRGAHVALRAGRLLQVFFTLGALPTPQQFGQLRRMALLASELPDLDIVSSSIELASGDHFLQQTGTADCRRLPRRKQLQTVHSAAPDRMQKESRCVILVGAFHEFRFCAQLSEPEGRLRTVRAATSRHWKPGRLSAKQERGTRPSVTGPT
jgi:hypothetical protein